VVSPNRSLVADDMAAGELTVALASHEPSPEPFMPWAATTADGAAPEARAIASDPTDRPALTGHVNSSWIGPEIDPPDAARLPQPWSIPKAALPPPAGGPVGEARSARSPLGSRRASNDSMAPPEMATDLWLSDVPFHAGPDAGPKGPAARPRPAAGPRVTGPVTRPVSPRGRASTRPFIMAAAVVTILIGGAYAVYAWVSRPPAVLPATQPVAAPPAPVPAPASPLAAGSLRGTETPQPGSPRAVRAAPATTGRAATGTAARNATARNAAASARRPRGAAAAAARSAAPAREATEATPSPLESRELPAAAGAAGAPVEVVATAQPPIEVPADAGGTGADATGDTSEVFELSEVDVRPVIRRRTEPRYPDGAQDPGLEDVVVLRVLVSSTGRPFDAQLLRRSKIDASFDQAAIAAVREWSFTPARKRDRPVASWVNVGVPFRPSPDIRAATARSTDPPVPSSR
jgi:protein TonB